MSTKPSHAAPRGLSRRVWSLLVSLVFVAGALLLGTARWIAARFGIITIDQVVINLRGAGGEGAGGTALVVGGIVAAVIVPIALAILVLLAIRRTQRSDWKRALPRLARVGVTTAIVGVLVAVPVAGARAISTTLSLPQLKILQEVITLSVFVPFAVLFMRVQLRWDFLWAGLCLMGAVYFMFRQA